MEDVGTLKAEREVIEKQLKDPMTDISEATPPRRFGSVNFLCFHSLAPKFLQALKELGDVDEEAISEAHLRGEFGKLQQQVIEATPVSLWCVL